MREFLAIIALDFIAGFLAHKTKPATDQYQYGISQLMRYTIGAVMLIVLGIPLKYWMQSKHGKEINLLHCLFSDIVTALFFGGGVVTGYAMDDD